MTARAVERHQRRVVRIVLAQARLHDHVHLQLHHGRRLQLTRGRGAFATMIGGQALLAAQSGTAMTARHDAGATQIAGHARAGSAARHRALLLHLTAGVCPDARGGAGHARHVAGLGAGGVGALLGARLLAWRARPRAVTGLRALMAAQKRTLARMSADASVNGARERQRQRLQRGCGSLNRRPRAVAARVGAWVQSAWMLTAHIALDRTSEDGMRCPKSSDDRLRQRPLLQQAAYDLRLAARDPAHMSAQRHLRRNHLHAPKSGQSIHVPRLHALHPRLDVATRQRDRHAHLARWTRLDLANGFAGMSACARSGARLLAVDEFVLGIVSVASSCARMSAVESCVAFLRASSILRELLKLLDVAHHIRSAVILAHQMKLRAHGAMRTHLINELLKHHRLRLLTDTADTRTILIHSASRAEHVHTVLGTREHHADAVVLPQKSN